MIKNKKKSKKKIYLNGIPKKIDYDAYIVIRNQEEQLKGHEDWDEVLPGTYNMFITSLHVFKNERGILKQSNI